MDLELDRRIRLAAFAHLERLQRTFGEVMPRTALLEGFTFEGRRVPLMSPQQGIFKPAVMEMPLSLVTAPVVAGRERKLPDDTLRRRFKSGSTSEPSANVWSLRIGNTAPCAA